MVGAVLLIRLNSGAARRTNTSLCTSTIAASSRRPAFSTPLPSAARPSLLAEILTCFMVELRSSSPKPAV